MPTCITPKLAVLAMGTAEGEGPVASLPGWWGWGKPILSMAAIAQEPLRPDPPRVRRASSHRTGPVRGPVLPCLVPADRPGRQGGAHEASSRPGACMSTRMNRPCPVRRRTVAAALSAMTLPAWAAAPAAADTPADEFLWLEDVLGDRALGWVRERNKATESEL